MLLFLINLIGYLLFSIHFLVLQETILCAFNLTLGFVKVTFQPKFFPSCESNFSLNLIFSIKPLFGSSTGIFPILSSKYLPLEIYSILFTPDFSNSLQKSTGLNLSSLISSIILSPSLPNFIHSISLFIAYSPS